MSSYLHAAFYRFSSWPDYRSQRAPLRDLCKRLGLTGTLLLSPEGLNGAVCGESNAVREVLNFIRQIPEFADLPARFTRAERPAYARMKVKLKREIISMGSVSADPRTKTGARLPPVELKQWLDEGKNFLLLDTRNSFEIAEGTFKGAADLDLEHFHDFPKRVEELRTRAKDRPIVMFCTGGIRCEKATSLALEHGLKNVYQLDGGILGYFEACGGAHYSGGCFVFDERVQVRP